MKSLIVPFVVLLALSLSGSLWGREATGRWTDESIFEYSKTFLDNLRTRFERRAEKVAEHGGKPLTFETPAMVSVLGQKDSRKWEEWNENDLSQRYGEKALEAYARDLEAFRKQIVEAEAAVKSQWTPESDSPNSPPKVVTVFGEEITAKRIGVILDNSPSMSPFLDAVRNEIQQKFVYEYFVEVDGSFLRHSRGNYSRDRVWNEIGSRGWYYEEPAPGINPFSSNRFIRSVPQADWHYAQVAHQQDNLGAIFAMVTLMEVDTVYWFCDMDDEVDFDAAKVLLEILEPKGVKLYLHTMARNPSRDLATVVERSGGRVIRKKPN